MDLAYAYDHIQDDAESKQQKDGESGKEEASLNKDLQEAYKSFSASPWGSRIGGFLGNVVKQGESVYTQASKEFAEVGEDASKGLIGLRQSLVAQTRGLTIQDVLRGERMEEQGDGGQGERSADAGGEAAGKDGEDASSETVLSRLRSEAAKRLKDLQKAEDAADEALLRFGGNIRNFLRDAVSIAPPDSSSQESSSSVLFESKDAKGKRVIHTSRFDAQLHVIHTSVDGFTKDASGPEDKDWSKGFDIDSKTADISADLEKYPDLRATMEKLVPDQIPYADFWKRYYFLRHGIETAEARRRELLNAASADDEIGWGDDSDDEDGDKDDSSDDDDAPDDGSKAVPKKPASVTSSTTIQPVTAAAAAAAAPAAAAPPKDTLKPADARDSNDEKSQADSEASYDVVGAASGLNSQAPSSPKDPKKADDDSDDDWE
ncbi:BSD protein [Geosmithia morbida]|uniref:BSD protein n=1 Tax=Geosmithia morbida TaxID=1094350 RepID=A0A9P5D2X3_9HYPO|nr:BSD protein [Geosmithia morbida]KAF4125568.1 BSD protein [Geosmithia morbida]